MPKRIPNMKSTSRRKFFSPENKKMGSMTTINVNSQLSSHLNEYRTVNPANGNSFNDGNNKDDESTTKKIDHFQDELSSGSDVNQTQYETSATDERHDRPSLPGGEGVADDCDDATGQRNGAADSECEQHQEKEDGKELRDKVEFADRFRIRDER